MTRNSVNDTNNNLEVKVGANGKSVVVKGRADGKLTRESSKKITEQLQEKLDPSLAKQCASFATVPIQPHQHQFIHQEKPGDKKLLTKRQPASTSGKVAKQKPISTATYTFDVCGGNVAGCIYGVPNYSHCFFVLVPTVPADKHITKLVQHERDFVYEGSPNFKIDSITPHESAAISSGAARYVHVCASALDQTSWRQAIKVEVEYQ